MAEDRSLKDIVRFADPSGEISDADIANITGDLKFSEVLDLISAVSKDDMDAARTILSDYDPRFGVASSSETQPEESITNEQILVKMTFIYKYEYKGMTNIMVGMKFHCN
jgi:hypothetical protein